MLFRIIILNSLLMVFVTGCASSKFKQRKEQRDSLVRGQGIYCDMVNGDLFPDVEVQLNIEMAKRCDSNKSFSISGYRAPTSDAVGVVYCCALASANKSDVEVKSPAKKTDENPSEKSEAKSDQKGPGASN
jgi:hypothetical protein